MKNKKNLATISLVLALVSLIPLIITPANLMGSIIFVVLAIVFAILAIIFGFISKSSAKGKAIAGIAIGVISAVFMFFALLGFLMMGKAKNCTNIDDNTATCEIAGQKIEIPRVFLKEEQYEKEN